MSVSGVYSNYAASSASNSTDSSKRKTGTSSLDINDFFKLLAAQLENQNMMDPVDNTDFIAQMAQFSTLSQMNELTSSSQMALAASMIGKSVTVLSTDSSGRQKETTGTVSGVTFESGTPYINIGSESYPMSGVTKINNG